MVNHRNNVDRVNSLQGILKLERSNGFQNKAVPGGLERFLKTLINEPASDPTIKALLENGLLHIQYSEDSVLGREIWVNHVQSYLGTGGKLNPQKPTKKQPPLETAIKRSRIDLQSINKNMLPNDQPTPRIELTKIANEIASTLERIEEIKRKEAEQQRARKSTKRSRALEAEANYETWRSSNTTVCWGPGCGQLIPNNDAIFVICPKCKRSQYGAAPRRRYNHRSIM